MTQPKQQTIQNLTLLEAIRLKLPLQATWVKDIDPNIVNYYLDIETDKVINNVPKESLVEFNEVLSPNHSLAVKLSDDKESIDICIMDDSDDSIVYEESLTIEYPMDTLDSNTYAKVSEDTISDVTMGYVGSLSKSYYELTAELAETDGLSIPKGTKTNIDKLHLELKEMFDLTEVEDMSVAWLTPVDSEDGALVVRIDFFCTNVQIFARTFEILPDTVTIQ